MEPGTRTASSTCGCGPNKDRQQNRNNQEQPGTKLMRPIYWLGQPHLRALRLQ